MYVFVCHPWIGVDTNIADINISFGEGFEHNKIYNIYRKRFFPLPMTRRFIFRAWITPSTGGRGFPYFCFFFLSNPTPTLTAHSSMGSLWKLICLYENLSLCEYTIRAWIEAKRNVYIGHGISSVLVWK